MISNECTLCTMKNHWSFVCSAKNPNKTCYFVLTINVSLTFAVYIFFSFIIRFFFSLLSPSAKKIDQTEEIKCLLRFALLDSRPIEHLNVSSFHTWSFRFQFVFLTFCILNPFEADLYSKYFIRSLPRITADLMRYQFVFCVWVKRGIMMKCHLFIRLNCNLCFEILVLLTI